MVERSAEEADKELASYILLGVTTGLSYTTLRTKHNIPCCKDIYYGLHRNFFLDSEQETKLKTKREIYILFYEERGYNYGLRGIIGLCKKCV